MPRSESGNRNPLPIDLKIELTLDGPMPIQHFTRYLSFKGHNDEWIRIPAKFGVKRGFVWQVEEFPEGLEKLHSLVETGNRHFWDRMYLENRGGNTALEIEHLLIEVEYEDPPGLSPMEVEHDRIPIVNSWLEERLDAGEDDIFLNPYAKASRCKWAGVDPDESRLLRNLAKDLGKSGSDGEGQDKYGSNPKYGGEVGYLCSEFVSWYYHRYDVKVGEASFKDITQTAQMHEIFKSAGQQYYYRNLDNSWRHVESDEAYEPQPGDYLERHGPAGPEHSMVLLKWDGERREAITFNGPWPVTLRRVKVNFEETVNDKTFYLGRIRE